MINVIKKELEFDDGYLKEFLSYVVDEPVFFNENKKVTFKVEIENYKTELNVTRDNMIPLIVLYDNEFLIFDIDNYEFKILDISDDFERDSDLNLIQKYIRFLEEYDDN